MNNGLSISIDLSINSSTITGSAAGSSKLLMETADDLLLETGDFILLDI